MTIPLYYSDPYLTSCAATVQAVEKKNNNVFVQLTQSIFYPVGGGQGCDVGEILSESGARMKVEQVFNRNGAIIHQGKVSRGEFDLEEEVTLALKWSARFHNMRSHTAGHLIHEALMKLAPGLVPMKANHGDKAFIEYLDMKGIFSDSLRDELATVTGQMIDADLPVFMSESSLDEIQTRCRHVPQGLPTNKPLRTVQIGPDGELVPCGGVHVASTREIGRIILVDVRNSDNGAKCVRYRITSAGGERSDVCVAHDNAMPEGHA